MPIFTSATIEPKGFYEIDCSSPTGLPSIPNNAIYAFIRAEGSDLIWRDDGGTLPPGHIIPMSRNFWYVGDLHKIRFIGTKATVTYYA